MNDMTLTKRIVSLRNSKSNTSAAKLNCLQTVHEG